MTPEKYHIIVFLALLGLAGIILIAWSLLNEFIDRVIKELTNDK